MMLENYMLAGKIASTVRENTRKKNHIDRTLLEICESIENEITLLGGKPAFPVNVSLNEIAAHYTAEPRDPIVVKDTDVIKIDLGVHINGYIADTAVTISYDSKYDHLVDVAELSLSEAIKISKINTKSGDIGKIIENTILHNGLKPIQNLSGHSLDQYTVHSGKSIPNIRTIGSPFSLVNNQAYAIEPFVTTRDGLGIVYEGKTRNIFGIASRKPTKDKEADEFLEYIWNTFKTLPFALRWMTKQYEDKKARQLIEQLIKKRNIHAYPVLIEGNRKIVTQAEHTLIPTDTFNNVITL